MSRYNIGKMRFPLKVMRPTRVSDGGGGSDRNDVVAVPRVMAEIRPASASEINRAMRLEMIISHMVILRYTPEIKHADLLVELTGMQRTMIVKNALNEDGRRRFLTLWCSESDTQWEG